MGTPRIAPRRRSLPASCAHRTVPNVGRWPAAIARRLRPGNLAVLVLVLCLAGCNGQAAGSDSGEPPVERTVTHASRVPSRQETAPPAAAVEARRSRTPTTEPLPVRPGFRTPVATAVEVHSFGSTQCSGPASFSLTSVQDSAQWSPDGTAVVFTHGRNVYAAAVGGTQVRQIVDPAPRGYDQSDTDSLADRVGRMAAISVSPDGAGLLYSTCEYPENYPASLTSASPLTQRDYQYDVALVSLAGGEPRRLTTHDAYDNFPVWSPDGTRIAFLSARHPALIAPAYLTPQLYNMAPDGSEVRHLARNLVLAHHPPQWSPDGQWLAVVAKEYERERPERRSDIHIYVVRADGTEVRRLGPAVSGSSWSPDGQRLAFAQPEESTVALVSIAVDGSDLRRLTTIDHWRGGSDKEPADAWIETVAWSPTGTQILVRPDDYFTALVAGVDDSSRTNVGILQVEQQPVGSPQVEYEGIRAAAWSPDGAQLVLVGPTYVATASANGGTLRGLARWFERDASWHPLNVGAQTTPVDVAGCAAGVAVADPAANPGLVADCVTLLQVQQALPEGAAQNWSVDRPVGEWYGITLGGTPLRVHEVYLYRTNPWPAFVDLHRPLPTALGSLTQLRVLRLNNYQFTGPIPSELWHLPSLQELRLRSNQLVGSIPPELSQVSSLEILDLLSNEMTGPIPPELSRLASLTYLSLSGNDFTGPIPSELGRLASLEYLALGRNQLSGPIPPEVAQLRNLVALFLHGNQLTGQIPPELGQLRNLDLLSLNDNQLTGQIPPELGRMESLSGLDLSGNQLTGCISPALDRLKPKPINANDADLPVCEPAA